MKLSFIVPIYNLEEYIEECIMSLLNQDIPHSEYEILCINDGSTDSSLEILERLAKEYTNIIIINQENQGVSAARNNGIENAKGEYIWFVDGDDLILNNCLKFLVDFMDEKSLPLVRFNIMSFYHSCKFADSHNLKNTNYSFINANNVYTPSSCCLIFRKNIIDILFNDKLRMFEDRLFSAYYQSKYYPYYWIDYNIYFYRQRNSSTMNDKKLSSIENNINDRLLLYKELSYRRNCYCKSNSILYAYQKLVNSNKSGYLLDIIKLPPDKFNIYYNLAVTNSIYPLNCNILHTLQKPRKECNFKTNINILLADFIMILISLRINCYLINRIVYKIYKKRLLY